MRPFKVAPTTRSAQLLTAATSVTCTGVDHARVLLSKRTRPGTGSGVHRVVCLYPVAPCGGVVLAHCCGRAIFRSGYFGAGALPPGRMMIRPRGIVAPNHNKERMVVDDDDTCTPRH